HAGAGIGDVFGAVLHAAFGHAALQGHDAVAHAHADLAGIHVVGLGQPLTEILLQAFGRALVALRSLAAIGGAAMGGAVTGRVAAHVAAVIAASVVSPVVVHLPGR